MSCKKIWRLDYEYNVFYAATEKKRKVGGNYPIGGSVVARVDKELLDIIKKYYNPNTKIKLGDCIEMDNGWTLD